MEENEVLDWEEDDEQQMQVPTAEDDADGVSLGSGSGDENEVHTVAAAVEEPRNLTAAVSGQRDASGVTRQAHPNAQGESSSKHPSSSLQWRDPENNGLSDSNVSPGKGGRKKPKRNREPPTSTLPKVHGLPPKPVASTLAFLAPSHPSLTEATAMSQSKGKNGLPSVPSDNSSSRAIGDQRPHSSGSNTKSSSSKSNSVTEAALPPDWQVRHSRSSDAAYYYNTRTHESTWVKPVPERSDTNRERSALSFEDRHYRPGAPDDIAGSSKHRPVALEAEVSSSMRKDRGPPVDDTWFGRSSFHNDEDGDSDDSYRGRPARNRRGRRSPSPPSPPRSRDVDMDARTTRHSTSQRQHERVSRLADGERAKDYDLEHGHGQSGADGLQIHASDRHWVANDEMHSHSRPGYDQALDGQKSATKSSRRRQPASPQGLSSQVHGNRQHDRVETFFHEHSREERKRNIYSSTALRSRDTDSREQRQPQSSLSSTNRHRSQSPPHIPLMTTAPPLEARNSATLASSASTSTLGRRSKPSRFAPASAAPVPEDVDDWVPDEFRTEAMNDPRPQDAERLRIERSHEQQRDNRESKPDNFSEERRDGGSRPERARSASPAAPLASPDVPASRRKRQPLPPQSFRFREMTSSGDGIQRDLPPHRDHGRSSKFGPPLTTPIATSTNIRMDIDSSITPSAPRAFDTLEPLPPSGPRGRSGSLDGDNSHVRGKAPPRRDWSRGRSRSFSRSRSRSKERETFISRERERESERLRRGDSSVELPRGPRAMELHPVVDSSSNELQGRRPSTGQPSHLPATPLPPVAPASRGRGGKGRGRRGREQVTATGTNNIPVRTRESIDNPAPAPPRYPSQYDPTPPSVPPKGLTGGNVVPLKNVRSRGYGSKAEEEPLISYSRSRSRTPPRRTRESPVRRDERDVMEIDRAGRPARARRDSFNEVRYGTSSFASGYEGPPNERTGTISRRRSPSPPSPAQYRQHELERMGTPPPSSRETSRVSPYDDRDEHRSNRHLRRSGDSMETVRVSRDTEKDNVREERNTIADGAQDSKQNGYKMQHPLPMNPMLLRMGPSTAVQLSGPSTSPSSSYPRHRDRSSPPLPPLVSGNRDGHAPSFSKDSADSPPVITRQSKPPVKIRRPPPLGQEMPSSLSHREPQQPMAVDEPRRPSPRCGGSLLDRLSGGVGNGREENVTPSLKDRVLVPSKRDRGELDEPMGSNRHEDYHAGNDGWDADDGGRGSSSVTHEGGSGKRRRPYRGGGNRKPRRSNKMPG